MSAGSVRLLSEDSAVKKCLLCVCVVLLMAADKETKDDESHAVQVIKKLGGSVAIDEKAPGKPVVAVSFASTDLTDDGLKEIAGSLAALKGLKSLDLYATEVTDAGLKQLAGLSGLQVLRLSATKITDAGMKHLKELKNLRELNLNVTKITDKGVNELATLKSLRRLLLLGSDVSDKGFTAIRQALPDCEVLGN
jgi:internalin A